MTRMASTVSLAVWLGVGGQVVEGSDGSIVTLVVAEGRLLRVALNERVRIKGAGQPITGTLVDPVYAYDRIVIPAGVQVQGRIDRLEAVSKGVRARAMLGGDFTPLRRASVVFDTLVMPGGTRLAIMTRVTSTAENVSVQTAAADKQPSRAARVKEAAAGQVRAAAAPFRAPRRMERFREMAINRLPYHPQYLHGRTVYDVELLSPLDFGTATPTAFAATGTAAPPDSVLNARLTTPLDSEKTPQGSPIRAVLTQPLFSADHLLILPEGTELRGEVTSARRARWLHRNGQLRFLFETVRLPAGASEKLLASLYSTQVSADERVAIDEEGGTRISSPHTRFIPPALAAFAAHASIGTDPVEAGEIGNATDIPGANVGGRAAGGFFGLGVAGIAVAQISRPVAGVLGFWGLAQTLYANVIAKGRNVVFRRDTMMQLRLSPAAPTQ